MQLTATFVTAPDLLAIGLPAGSLDLAFAGLPGGLAAELLRVAEDDRFQGKAGATLQVRPLGAIGSRWVVLVGLGDGSVEAVRHAAGALGSVARDRGAVTMAWHVPPSGVTGAGAATVRAVAEGLSAGNYRWDRYKAASDRKPSLDAVQLVGFGEYASAWAHGQVHAAAQALTRDVVNEQAELLYPETMAAMARGLAGPHTTVEVWDEERIRAEGMGGISAVGQGSARPPRFVHITFTPAGWQESDGRVGIVGKGVTFDTGGLSIKPTDGMLTMRCDMGGAGVVLGVMSALEALRPRVRVQVHGIFALAENMLGGRAYKLGDVLTMYNGKTVEIHNTDAEGRLLLADCLAYASKLGLSHLIDLATLTGAAVVALGEHYSALYSPDDAFAASWAALGADTGDGLWRMPLEDSYKEKLKSDVAQLKNVGDRWGGSITAALFLAEFVSGPIWAHFDIAGPAFLSGPDRFYGKGATGAMVRPVLRWLEGL